MERKIAYRSDEEIFEEAMTRLRSFFKRSFGVDIKNGSFKFIVHHGRFQAIEAQPKLRGYLSPNRFKSDGFQPGPVG